MSDRAIVSVRMQVDFGVEHGVSTTRLLAGSGLSDASLSQPDVFVTREQELTVVANLCGELGNRAELGLAMGRRYHLSSYGVWGFALLSSGTFRDAVILGLRYLDLTYAFNRITLEEQATEAALVIDNGDLPAGVGAYLLARDLSAIATIQHELFDATLPWSSIELTLPARPPGPFEAQFGVTPTFEQAHNRARFPTSYLDRPLPHANPAAARLCEQQCEQLVARTGHRAGMAARVRERLLARPGHFPSMDALATELGATTRTLRRRLAAEGTGYRELLDEVRRMLAEQWLLMGALTQEDISDRLGFSEVSNFVHAFRRWTGQTPARFRRHAQTPRGLAR